MTEDMKQKLLEPIKDFLRIDTDAEDDTLLMLNEAADEHLKSVLGTDCSVSDSRYQLVKFMLIGDWYENRSLYEKGSYSRAIGSLILQLQLEQEA